MYDFAPPLPGAPHVKESHGAAVFGRSRRRCGGRTAAQPRAANLGGRARVWHDGRGEDVAVISEEVPVRIRPDEEYCKEAFDRHLRTNGWPREPEWEKVPQEN